MQNSITQALNEIREYFNANTTFQKVESLSERQVNILISSLRSFGAEKIKQAFARAERSDYLTGRKGCDWHADFDWIIVPAHIANILNGKYDDFKYRSNAYNSFGVKSGAGDSESSFDLDEFVAAALNRGFKE